MKYMIITVCTSFLLLIIFLIICNAIVYIIEFYLDFRQSRHLKQTNLPDELHGYGIDENEFHEMKDYVINCKFFYLTN